MIKAYEPNKNVRFSKVLDTDPLVAWKVTKESNGYLVWRGACEDKKDHRHDDSDWNWWIMEFHYSSSPAIESCVIKALEEENRNV